MVGVGGRIQGCVGVCDRLDVGVGKGSKVVQLYV